MVRTVVITCVRAGTASRCLPALARAKGVEVAAVLLATAAGGSRSRRIMRRIKKIAQIGLLGAFNGIRMRKWFSNPAEDIEVVCAKFGIPFREVCGLNSPEMVDAVKGLSPDLGVSLGNGFISPRVFDVPRLGMINLHTEILPAYQNAQSIIWPIYCNDPYTGYTIHEIVRTIDAGRILLQRRRPIEFKPTLEETVRFNKRRTDELYPEDVAYAVSHIEELKTTAQEQGPGGHYTTPSFWQFLRMVRNNQKFWREING